MLRTFIVDSENFPSPTLISVRLEFYGVLRTSFGNIKDCRCHQLDERLKKIFNFKDRPLNFFIRF